MNTGELLNEMVVGGLVGMLGQSARMIMGLKKSHDDAVAKGLSFKDDVFDAGKLRLSLVIGAVAGILGLLSLNQFQAMGDIDWKLFLTILGFGYAGTDFIEGFIQRSLPQTSGGGSTDVARSQPQGDDARGVVQALSTFGGAEVSTAGRNIIEICDREWSVDDNKGNCSSFVRDVAGALGVVLKGQADDIVDQISGPGWTQLAHDGAAAKRAADRGDLVVAGLKGIDQDQPSDHGHVAIVVSGPLYREKYPLGYWGSLTGTGARNEPLTKAWRTVDLEKVVYAGKTV